jgi:hypothetical protein
MVTISSSGLREDILESIVARQKKLISKYGKDDPRTSCIVLLGKF